MYLDSQLEAFVLILNHREVTGIILSWEVINIHEMAKSKVKTRNNTMNVWGTGLLIAPPE
jgi:hypothetical protein